KRFSAQTNSIATFCPSTSPASFKPLRNAATFLTFVEGVPLLKKTITGIGCCAYTTRGSATVAPPISAMKSRRRMPPPGAKDRCQLNLAHGNHVRFGSLQDICCAKGYVPLYPQKRTPEAARSFNSHDDSASSKALASLRSRVPKPSVNQPNTGTRRSRASSRLP